MPAPGAINNHISQALARLVQQYKGAPNIEGLLTSFVTEIQNIEDALQDVFDAREIEEAFGKTLDNIGEIVGQTRLGFDDAFYRNLIRAKIGENVSQGDPERVIEIAKLLSGATLVYLEEYYPGGFGVSVNTTIAADLINFFYERLDKVDPVAVRLEALISFDPDEPFAFEGGTSMAKGFGSTTDLAEGGKFAELKIRTKPEFAFEGESADSDDYEGFGTLDDVYFGGIFQGI